MYSVISKYDHTSSFLNRFRNSADIKSADSFLRIRSGITPGVFKDFTIKNNIHFLCAQYHSSEDIHLTKLPSANEFFILRIYETSHDCSAFTITNDKYYAGMYANNQVALLLSSLEEFTFFAPKNSRIKTLEIKMPRRWFFSQLNIECPYGLLKKYMAVKSGKTQIGCGNRLFRNLFFKIIREGKKEVSDWIISKIMWPRCSLYSFRIFLVTYIVLWNLKK